MVNKSLRQLQKQVFDTFIKLENQRHVILSKADELPNSIEKLTLLAKASGLGDGIIGLKSLIELIKKQNDEEKHEIQNLRGDKQ